MSVICMCFWNAATYQWKVLKAKLKSEIDAKNIVRKPGII